MLNERERFFRAVNAIADVAAKLKRQSLSGFIAEKLQETARIRRTNYQAGVVGWLDLQGRGQAVFISDLCPSVENASLSARRQIEEKAHPITVHESAPETYFLPVSRDGTLIQSKDVTSLIAANG